METPRGLEKFNLGLCFRSAASHAERLVFEAQDGTMTTTGTQQQVTPSCADGSWNRRRPGIAPSRSPRGHDASGWNEEVAVEALETTLRDCLEEQAHIRGLPPAVPVPDPLLDESPCLRRAGDRRVAVLQSMYHPRVVVFGSCCRTRNASS